MTDDGHKYSFAGFPGKYWAKKERKSRDRQPVTPEFSYNEAEELRMQHLKKQAQDRSNG